jgi:hypothetical protein
MGHRALIKDRPAEALRARIMARQAAKPRLVPAKERRWVIRLLVRTLARLAAKPRQALTKEWLAEAARDQTIAPLVAKARRAQHKDQEVALKIVQREPEQREAMTTPTRSPTS